MIVKLLTEQHLEFLSLKGGCRGSSESTLVKMSNCWKSHAAALVGLVLVYGSPDASRRMQSATFSAEMSIVDQMSENINALKRVKSI